MKGILVAAGIVAVLVLIKISTDTAAKDSAVRYEVTHGITSANTRYQILDTPEAMQQGRVVVYDNETEEILITKPATLMKPGN